MASKSDEQGLLGSVIIMSLSLVSSELCVWCVHVLLSDHCQHLPKSRWAGVLLLYHRLCRIHFWVISLCVRCFLGSLSYELSMLRYLGVVCWLGTFTTWWKICWDFSGSGGWLPLFIFSFVVCFASPLGSEWCWLRSLRTFDFSVGSVWCWHGSVCRVWALLWSVPSSDIWSRGAGDRSCHVCETVPRIRNKGGGRIWAERRELYRHFLSTKTGSNKACSYRDSANILHVETVSPVTETAKSSSKGLWISVIKRQRQFLSTETRQLYNVCKQFRYRVLKVYIREALDSVSIHPPFSPSIRSVSKKHWGLCEGMIDSKVYGGYIWGRGQKQKVNTRRNTQSKTTAAK